MEKFKALGLDQDILNVLKKEGFEEPTEVQEKSIPFILDGKDVIAGSATGSGKTLAFGAGLLQRSTYGRGIQGLVLTPTRELAEQISMAIKKFAGKKKLNIVVVYGGVSINPQIANLRRADIVIATPGRLLDHIERGTINLSKVNTFVLDEADRMVDMGFIEDVMEIMHQCPKKRQTLLFSATISRDIIAIAKKFMDNPVSIQATEMVDPKKLRQVYYDVPSNVKFSLLVHLLKEEKTGLIMVFCNTRNNVDLVANNLNKLGMESIALHGGFTQDKRSKTLNTFHSKNVHVLVCTDVAARGLDIKGVSHVYNYDIPKESKQYIHRIGRTARAGEQGIAVSLLTRRDYENFRKVLDDNDLTIPKEQVPKVPKVDLVATRDRGGFRDNNRSGSRGGRGSSDRGSSRGYSRGGSSSRNSGSSSSRGGSGSFGRSSSSRDSSDRSSSRGSSSRGSSFSGSSSRSSSPRSSSPRSGSGAPRRGPSRGGRR